jgi:hypothetical protein
MARSAILLRALWVSRFTVSQLFAVQTPGIGLNGRGSLPVHALPQSQCWRPLTPQEADHADRHAEEKSKGWSRREWVSLVPYGVNQEHPNAYSDILEATGENKDQLGYAWRILRDGCCDGCSLGTSGIRD